MGISSSKSKTTPVYAPQVEGAGRTLTNVYNDTAPGIRATSQALTGLIPDIVADFRNGDPGVNAARDYNVDVLSGRYLNEGNPYLEQVLSNSNDDIRNQLQAALGAKGLTGGSSYADLISKNIAKNTLATRYNAYSDERGRMDAAAGRAPGTAAAEYIPVASLLGLSEAAQAPLRAATGYSSGLGSLLGSYTNTEQKGAWGPMLLGALSNVAAAYAGGG